MLLQKSPCNSRYEHDTTQHTHLDTKIIIIYDPAHCRISLQVQVYESYSNSRKKKGAV
jgi:hypothetical protein